MIETTELLSVANQFLKMAEVSPPVVESDATNTRQDVDNSKATPMDRQKTASSSCVDYLIAETVRYYREQEKGEVHGPPMAATLGAIGENLGKVFAERLSRDKPPMVSHLEIMKWICKEFWNAIFLKGIDNLRTNHKGTFVLRDTQFRWTRRVSQNVYGGVERLPYSLLCVDYLILPAAILQGALSTFGIEATVSADSTALPQVDFTVVCQPSSA